MGLKKNISYNIILTVSNFLFPLIIYPYITRKLGPEGIGITSFVENFARNFIIVASGGISIYGVKEISKVKDNINQRSRLFFELITIHSILTIIASGFYFIAIISLNDFNSLKNIYLIGIIFIISNLFTIEWFFIGMENFKYIAIRTITFKVLFLMSVLLFVKEKSDFTLYFFLFTLMFIFNGVVNFKYAFKLLKLNKFIINKSIKIHFKPLFLLGSYLVLTSIYSLVPNNILGILGSKFSLGIFSTANKCVRIIISLFSAISMALIPRMSIILKSNGIDTYKLFINNTLRIITSIVFPILIFTYFYADKIIFIVAGPDFVDSIICLQILAPIILAVAIAQILVLQVLNIMNKEFEMIIIALTGTIISLFINLMFVERFNELASSYSILISEFVVTGVAMFYVRKYIPLRKNVLSIFRNLLFSIPYLLLAYVNKILFHDSFLALSITIVLSCFYFLFYQIIILKESYIIEILGKFNFLTNSK